jgi:hypothetical protein
MIIYNSNATPVADFPGRPWITLFRKLVQGSLRQTLRMWLVEDVAGREVSTHDTSTEHHPVT